MKEKIKILMSIVFMNIYYIVYQIRKLIAICLIYFVRFDDFLIFFKNFFNYHYTQKNGRLKIPQLNFISPNLFSRKRVYF